VKAAVVTVTPHSTPCLLAPSFAFTHQLRVATPTDAPQRLASALPATLQSPVHI